MNILDPSIFNGLEVQGLALAHWLDGLIERFCGVNERSLGLEP